jgi:hypothetical protein
LTPATRQCCILDVETATKKLPQGNRSGGEHE